ncbi:MULTISPECIES: sugar transporter [unclassified Sulfitobacter]|uniref:sugar transporter n=1 Tax=unclassified Sulfitobacter TaxID=196795 RepID=UPI0007C2D4D1|nr:MULTISPECIES: sugar transporter [unclassified Sulfitobacter]KZX98995.1 sugar transporter [Sulfitobacter sp. HI0021]KZY04519.1 sugar transporter [Sulfitobacter sp. HI0027]KZZ01201.1 sugar transporter [Sulfitobacter sp. HI0076]
MTSSSDPASPAADTPPKKPSSEPKPAPKAASDSTPKAESKPAPKPKAKPKKEPKAPVPPVAGPARMRKRHYRLAFSFILLVLLPTIGAGYYLYTMAKDQFVSEVGFTVRREEAPLVSNLLTTLGNVSSSSSSDSDILFEYVRSQELVRRVDEEIDLRSLYGAVYDEDPLFGLDPDATIEELVDYWQRVVRVSYAPSTGLLELEVRAFDPQTATRVARLVFSKSSEMINELSQIARDDATRYAREDLERAQADLKALRQSLTEFRMRTQIVDPQAAIQGQMGLLASLQQQLGEALIEYDLLVGKAPENDPRILQVKGRLEAIRARIDQERQQFGQGGDVADGENYATMVARFEQLLVEREFAEQKYATAVANFDRAQTEAQRQSRYLAAYVGPTEAESAIYPRRLMIFLLVAFFSTIAWAILALVYYSLRDRR